MKGAFVLLAAWLATTAPAQVAAPDPAEPLFRRLCTRCHESAVALVRRNTPGEWRVIVTQMVAKGMPGTDEEIALVTDYLNRRRGLIRVNRLSAPELQQALQLSAEQARALVERRERDGPYADFDDLLGVASVDAAQLHRYRASLRFDR